MKTFLIRIVDDEEEIRFSLEFLLRADGWDVISYPDANTLLSADNMAVRGCYILDIRMPGMNGLSLQKELARKHCSIPVIFLTAHGDIDMCVQAMKEGAVDFLIKPVDEERLLRNVAQIRRNEETGSVSKKEAMERWNSLTPREQEILPLLAQGLLNRMVAERLDLSQRTVQTHRQLGMKTLGVKSIAELNRFLSELHKL